MVNCWWSVCLYMRWEWYWVVRRMSKTFVIQRILPQDFVLDNKTFVLEWEVSEFTLVFAWSCPESWLWPLPFWPTLKWLKGIFWREKRNTAWTRQLGNRNGSIWQQRSGHGVHLMLHSKVINSRHYLIQSSSFFTPCPSCSGWPIGSRARTNEEDAEPERVQLQQATSSENGQVHVCQNQDVGHWCLWWSVSYT